MTSTSSPRVRMSPDDRREQLLGIGVQMLSTRPLEEMSIELLAEEAGISRGLLYHYFANKQEFHVAVIRRAVEDLYAITAPRDIEDPMARLLDSMAAYVDYVVDNHAGYLSLVRAAKGGNEELRQIYETAREALTVRVFEAVGEERLRDLGIEDNEINRFIARGWASFCEEMVLAWVKDPAGISRERLLEILAVALPGVLGVEPPT